MNTLRYSVNENGLRSLGYTFQKLYAANYKTYWKKIGPYDMRIWLWVAGKTIEVNDWHGNTGNIIAFYMENRNHASFDEPCILGGKRDYLKIQFNRETGEVKPFDYDEYFKAFESKDRTKWDALYSPRIWREEVLHRHEMELLLSEIDRLVLLA